MSGKSAKLYTEVFQFIERSKLFKINPKASFMLDFESGLRKSIALCYPNATINGCWYHFIAAVQRKFRVLHMMQLLASNQSARTIYRKFLNLPLLPAEQIVSGYTHIKEEASEKCLSKEFKKIFEYFESFWLNMVSGNPHNT